MNVIMLVCGNLICLLASILSIISTLIPNWLYYYGSFLGQEGRLNIGLWQICMEYNTFIASGTTCRDIDEDKNWLQIVKAFMVIGNVCLTVSTILGLLCCKCTVQGSIFMSLLGGSVLLITVIVFGTVVTMSSISCGVCFVLTFLSALLAFISANMMRKAMRQNNNSKMHES